MRNDFFVKATAIGETIIISHPFIHGNKRTGYVLKEAILSVRNIKITADNDPYNFVISIYYRRNKIEQIVEWVKKNTK